MCRISDPKPKFQGHVSRIFSTSTNSKMVEDRAILIMETDRESRMMY